MEKKKVFREVEKSPNEYVKQKGKSSKKCIKCKKFEIYVFKF